MASPTPTMDQVTSAIVAQMQAMSPLPGTVLHFENNLDDEAEFLEQYLLSPPNVEAHVWLIIVTASPDFEGEAVGQVFCVFNVRLRYWSIMTNNQQWSRDAQARGERVRDQLSKNSSVFAIGGQRQLRTAETVELASHGFEGVGDQRAFLIELRLQVEARRWT